MASDDAERRGRRRWFRILGSSESAESSEREAGAVDVMTEDPDVGDDRTQPESSSDELIVEVDDAVADAPADAETDTGAASTNGDAVAPGTEAAAEPDDVEPAPEPMAAAEPMTLPRVLAIANQKGGVGKTTTAVNLGAALAELGYRVLVVDLDPQGNATTGLGISHRNVEGSIYDVIMNDVPVEDCVEPTSVRNLFVVPATIDLAGAEIELVPAFSRELKLRRAIQSARDEYDFVMIDCPPSLGLLTVNGLAAADDVIVPIQCEYYALEGPGAAAAEPHAGEDQPEPDARPAGDRAHDVRRPHQARRTGGAGGARALRAEGVPDRRSPYRPHLGGAVVRAAGHGVRLVFTGCRGLPGTRQGGE